MAGLHAAGRGLAESEGDIAINNLYEVNCITE